MAHNLKTKIQWTNDKWVLQSWTSEGVLWNWWGLGGKETDDDTEITRSVSEYWKGSWAFGLEGHESVFENGFVIVRDSA